MRIETAAETVTESYSSDCCRSDCGFPLLDSCQHFLALTTIFSGHHPTHDRTFSRFIIIELKQIVPLES
jgi:hypothetical protein